MARVFLWYPQGTNVGHLSMELNRDKTYISFWPNRSGKLNDLFGKESTSYTLDQDKVNEGRNFDDYISIPEDMINHDNIVHWWNNRRPKMYSLFDYNCARCVYDALQAGGFKVFRENTWLEIGKWIRFPDDDDPTYEEMEWKLNNTIEDKPVIPSTAFKWISQAVQDHIKGKSESKCIIF